MYSVIVQFDTYVSAEDFLRRHSLAAFLILTAIASVRIAFTYTVFNETIDEIAHIACGMEWLDKKVYHYEAQHPPLARVMTAIGPYLAGSRPCGWIDPWKEGAAILHAGHHYDRTLALARMGILPFFWLASLAVYLWSKRSFGEPSAFFATLCFTNLPPVLAHGGLATTDMALAATVGAAFLAMLWWMERPSWTRSILLGAALAAAVLSKFSSLAFLPAASAAAFIGYFIVERPRFADLIEWTKARLRPAAMAFVVGAALIWAGYRLSFNRVPAPELWRGIQDVMAHNQYGHPAYLLGQYRTTGWWYYYPLVLGVKTPLALLGLLAVGIGICWKRRRSAWFTPLAFALGIVVFSAAFSRINLGVRHVLPVYIGFSLVAGVGACWLWSRGRVARVVLAALLTWMIASSAWSHPDYLAYFNQLAGDQPERILVDSDLDWGQDMKRLARRLKEVGAKQVAFDPFSAFYVEYLEAVGEFPVLRPLDARGPAAGWNAASITKLKLWRMGRKDRGEQLWTDRIPPTERVGRGVLLWYFPPENLR